jgi:hypothetical protein
MHAWVEYFDNGWKSEDAVVARRLTPASAAPPPADLSSGFDDPQRNIPPIKITLPSRSRFDAGGAKPDADRPVEAGNEPDAGAMHDAGTMRAAFKNVPSLTEFFAVAAGLFFCFAVFIFSRSSKGTLHLSKTGDEARADAAKMASAAMSYPNIFHNAELLFESPLLKTMGKGDRISIAKARQLAEDGRLYAAERPSPLTDAAKARGTKVLVASDPAFKEISSQLGGLIDLDEIVRISPLTHRKIPAEYGRVRKQLEAVNRIIAAAGLSSHVEVRFSMQLQSEKVRDISLPGIYRNPVHKVVIPSASPLLRVFESDNGCDDNLAAAGLLDGLLNESDLLSDAREELLLASAERVFEVPS